jgi:hypothetical protein
MASSGFFCRMCGCAFQLWFDPTTVQIWLLQLLTIMGAWMPTVAAVTITGMLDGRAAIQILLRGFLRFHISSKCFFAALIPWVLAFAGPDDPILTWIFCLLITPFRRPVVPWTNSRILSTPALVPGPYKDELQNLMSHTTSPRPRILLLLNLEACDL